MWFIVRSSGNVTHSLQDQIDAAVKQLLALKAEYKQVTGKDYKPGAPPAGASPAGASPSAPAQAASTAPTVSSSSDGSPMAIYEHVTQQGDLVRKLKTDKAPKVCIRFHFIHFVLFVKLLLLVVLSHILLFRIR